MPSFRSDKQVVYHHCPHMVSSARSTIPYAPHNYWADHERVWGEGAEEDDFYGTLFSTSFCLHTVLGVIHWFASHGVLIWWGWRINGATRSGPYHHDIFWIAQDGEREAGSPMVVSRTTSGSVNHSKSSFKITATCCGYLHQQNSQFVFRRFVFFWTPFSILVLGLVSWSLEPGLECLSHLTKFCKCIW